MKELLKHLTLVDFIVEIDEEIKSGKFQLKHNKSKGLQFLIDKNVKNKYDYYCLRIRKRCHDEFVIDKHLTIGNVTKVSSQDIRDISLKKYHEFVLKKFGKSVEDFKQEKRKWETLSIN